MKLEAVQQFNLIYDLYNVPVMPVVSCKEPADYTLFAWKMDVLCILTGC